MYSPKISEDLIPFIYKLAKNEKKPMTQVVDEILRKKIDTQKEQGVENEQFFASGCHQRYKLRRF